jgi:hypothetical protein
LTSGSPSNTSRAAPRIWPMRRASIKVISSTWRYCSQRRRSCDLPGFGSERHVDQSLPARRGRRSPARHIKQSRCTVSAIAFLLPVTELSMTTQATINASSAAATSLTSPIAEAPRMARGPIIYAITQGSA